MKKPILYGIILGILLASSAISSAQCPNNCDDNNPCTFDFCRVDTIFGPNGQPGTTVYTCVHTPIGCQTWYLDADGDGYYSALVGAATSPGAGWSTSSGLGGGDCNDNPATGGDAIHPGATELCNGIDDDCDGKIDEDFDTDGDGYTTCGTGRGLGQPFGLPSSAFIDCNDLDITEHPEQIWYQDHDKDGYGNPDKSQISCKKPIGYVKDNTDCNDDSFYAHPGSTISLPDLVPLEVVGPTGWNCPNGGFTVMYHQSCQSEPTIIIVYHLADQFPTVPTSISELKELIKNPKAGLFFDFGIDSVIIYPGKNSLLEPETIQFIVSELLLIDFDKVGILEDWPEDDVVYKSTKLKPAVYSAMSADLSLNFGLTANAVPIEPPDFTYFDITPHSTTAYGCKDGSLDVRYNSNNCWDVMGIVAINDLTNEMYFDYLVSDLGNERINELLNGGLDALIEKLIGFVDKKFNIQNVTKSEFVVFLKNKLKEKLIPILQENINIPEINLTKNTAVFTGLPAGHYTLLGIENSPWYAEPTSIEILQPKINLVLSANVLQHSHCENGSDGSLSINIDADYCLDNFAYSLEFNSSGNKIAEGIINSPLPSTSIVIAQLSGGEYLIRVTDNYGNSFEASATIKILDFDCDGFTEEQGDCDDHDPTVNVNKTWYLDADGDSYYLTTQINCKKPDGIGWSLNPGIEGDCADDDETVHEIQTWYLDADGDGFYLNIINSCKKPAGEGWSLTPSIEGDCADDDASVHEIQIWYLDVDGDGYYINKINSCKKPAGEGWSLTPSIPTDCNDNPLTGGAAIHPGAFEICANGIDENCNGMGDDICGGNFCFAILATKSATLSHSNVLFGGVGVTGLGNKAVIENQTHMDAPSCFVSADIQIIDNSSTVFSRIGAPTVSLPIFETNTSTGGIDKVIPNNASVTLDESNYRDIILGKNSTVTFTRDILNVRNIISSGEGAILKFASCTHLRVSNGISLGRNTIFNNVDNEIFVFAERNVDFGRGSAISVNLLYAKGNISVASGTSNISNNMFGKFIGNRVTSGDYTNWTARCRASFCFLLTNENNLTMKTGNIIESNSTLKEILPSDLKFRVKIIPNPSALQFSMIIEGEDEKKNYQMKLYDISGKLLETKSHLTPGKTIRFGDALKSGTYIVEVFNNTERQTLKIVKIN